MLLLAARARPDFFRSLVLLCPADGASLLAGLDRFGSEQEPAPGALERVPDPAPDAPERVPGPAPADRQSREYGGRFDEAALRPFLEALDLVAAASGMPRVLLAHARDDDSVAFAHSERLAAVLAPPSEFIALHEGGHHGPGRSPLVARATIDSARAHGRLSVTPDASNAVSVQERSRAPRQGMDTHPSDSGSGRRIRSRGRRPVSAPVSRGPKARPHAAYRSGRTRATTPPTSSARPRVPAQMSA